MFHIFGAIGEFERQLIRERTQAGLKAARAVGALAAAARPLPSRLDHTIADVRALRHDLKASEAALHRIRRALEDD